MDGGGRRIGKKVNDALVAGWLYRDDLRIVAETDGAGAVVSRFVYTTRSHAPNYMVRAGETYRILADHVGSIRLIVRVSDGTVVQRIDYDEFGVVTNDTNPGFQPFGFAAGQYDADTRLVHFGVRDYDPETGRWTAKDPLRFDAGDTNLYAYVKGDPINFVDPTGLQTGVITFPSWLGGRLAGAAAGAAGGAAVSGAPGAIIGLCIGIALTVETDAAPTKKCDPCPSPPGPESRIDTSHSHFPCPGAHVHHYEYEYNQNPDTCTCFLKKVETAVTCL